MALEFIPKKKKCEQGRACGTSGGGENEYW